MNRKIKLDADTAYPRHKHREEMTDKLNRQRLAALNFCREFLHIHGFITDAENDEIHKRIGKYQDRNRIRITAAQLLIMELKYDDNAKDE